MCFANISEFHKYQVIFFVDAGPTLESKGVHAIFQKKGKENDK